MLGLVSGVHGLCVHHHAQVERKQDQEHVSNIVMVQHCKQSLVCNVGPSQYLKHVLDLVCAPPVHDDVHTDHGLHSPCLLYTSPSPRDATLSRMPSSA